MKLKSDIKVHNKFVIEKINAKTNEIVQRGYAENIILNRCFDRVCAYNTYFRYIHYGEGTGLLSNTRTTLFTPIGCKSVTTVSSENAYPVSQVTKMIELSTQDNNGKTLTEVGISESTNAINTHALIKDAEGNNLSIEKTENDLVRIYATVYVEFEHPSENFKFIFPNNAIAKYFIDHTVPSTIIQAGKTSSNEAFGFNIYGSKSATKTNGSSTNKKNKLKTRFLVAEANADILEIRQENALSLVLPETGVFSGFQVEKERVGVGDGTKKEFFTGVSEFATDVDVYVDGNIVNPTDYSFVFFNTIGDAVDNDLLSITGNSNAFDDDMSTYVQFRYPPNQFNFNLNDNIKANFIYALLYSGGQDIVFGYSTDEGISYAEITIWIALEKGINPHVIKVPVTATHFYFKNPSSYNFSRVYEIFFGLEKASKIIFNNVISNDAVVEIDYKLPYIPKSEKYELEVEFETNFSEGV